MLINELLKKSRDASEKKIVKNFSTQEDLTKRKMSKIPSNKTKESVGVGFVQSWMQSDRFNNKAKEFGISKKDINVAKKRIREQTVVAPKNREDLWSVFSASPNSNALKVLNTLSDESVKGFHMKKDNVSVAKNGKTQTEAIVHETVHSSGLDENFSGKLGDELYPRVMQFRYENKLTPKDSLTSEKFKTLPKKSAGQLDRFYNDNELVQLLNKLPK